MDINKCFELGYIAKPHGIKGEVTAVLDTIYPQHFKKLDAAFLLMKGQLVPFFIEKITINGLHAIIQFEDIQSVAEAENLKSAAIYLPLEKLPVLKNGEYFLFELIDCMAFDSAGGEIGIVTQIYNTDYNDMIAVIHKGAEVLVPVNEHFIKKVDKNKKEITLDLPDGYLEVYTSAEDKRDDGEEE